MAHDNELQLFPYELIRYDLLSELFPDDEQDILYWAGRALARKHPLDTIEELTAFFEKAGWGALSLTNDKKQTATFQLDPYSSKGEHYNLEAGFLAEQMEQIKGGQAESHPTKKRKYVQFDVNWHAS